MKPAAWLLLLSPWLAGPAIAAEQSDFWTLEANTGVANGGTGSEELSAQLFDQGLAAQARSSDDTRFAWQLRLGYACAPHWGFELGYVDLGDVETRFTGSTLDVDAFLSASRDIHPNTADGFILSGVYRHPLGRIPRLEGMVRAGVFIWSSEYDLKGAERTLRVDVNGTSLSFGLGLSLGLDRLQALPPDTAAQIEWQRFNLDDEWIDLFSLGLSFRFH